jgi:hypothetical protein
MNWLVIVLFSLPMVFGTTAMSIIIHYLNNKAIIKRNIQDQVQVDLAYITLLYVHLYSSMFIACELFGPLNSTAVLNTALWFIQCLFNMGFNCIVAIQFIQFCSIFGLTFLSEWPDFQHLILTRTLVFLLGFIMGTGLCSVSAGSCRKSKIYNYFLMDNLQVDEDKPSMLSGVTWVIYGILIMIWQISIEIKRYLLNKADCNVDNLALLATKQLQDALSKLQIQIDCENGSKNLQMSDEPNLIIPGLIPKFIQNLKVSPTSPKLALDVEKDQTFFDNQRDPPASQHPPEKNIDLKTTRDIINVVDNIGLPNVANFEDSISVIEEAPVQAINHHLCSVNNKSVPNKNEVQAWAHNDQIENPQFSYLVISNNKLSRDQVNMFCKLENCSLLLFPIIFFSVF